MSYGLKNGLIQMQGGIPEASESLVTAAEQAGVSQGELVALLTHHFTHQTGSPNEDPTTYFQS